MPQPKALRDAAATLAAFSDDFTHAYEDLYQPLEEAWESFEAALEELSTAHEDWTFDERLGDLEVDLEIDRRRDDLHSAWDPVDHHSRF